MVQPGERHIAVMTFYAMFRAAEAYVEREKEADRD
jgi:hypothetical protein